MTRRNFIVTKIAAISTATAIPLTVAEAQTFNAIDVEGVADRLHQLAFHIPQVSDRVDRLLADLDNKLNEHASIDELLALGAAVKSRGREMSLDWLICGGGVLTNGGRREMFMDEAPKTSKEEQIARLAAAISKLDTDSIKRVHLVMLAMRDDEWTLARKWRDEAFASKGIEIEQI